MTENEFKAALRRALLAMDDNQHYAARAREPESIVEAAYYEHLKPLLFEFLGYDYFELGGTVPSKYKASNSRTITLPEEGQS